MSEGRRPGRRIVEPERYFIVAILSGVVSVISLLAVLLSADAASERNSGTNQVVKLMGHATAVVRGEIVMIHYLAITGVVVGIAGCVAALAIYIRS